MYLLEWLGRAIHQRPNNAVLKFVKPLAERRLGHDDQTEDSVNWNRR